jgi:hypothetical protein
MAKKLSTQTKFQNIVKRLYTKAKKRYTSFISRRPHRSFKKTQRRDYERAWKVPGYWAFTLEVKNILWSNKWLFAKFIALYTTFSFLIVGLLSQDNFDLLNTTINQMGGDVIVGELSGLVQNIAVFAGVFAGSFSQNLTEAQQVYSSLLFLISWLTIVWLLRQIMAGHKNIKLRDGLYASGSPLVSTFLLFFVLLVQLIPFAIAIIAYGIAGSVDVFSDVLFTTLFWIAELVLVVLSAYWLTSTSIALVVVTLPGMYPLRAIKASGDLVIGRRLRILYRLAWLVLTVVIFWAIIILPFILISQISWLSNLPIVPIVVLILGALTMLWSSTYMYILYRKLVSDDAKPA